MNLGFDNVSKGEAQISQIQYNGVEDVLRSCLGEPSLANDEVWSKFLEKGISLLERLEDLLAKTPRKGICAFFIPNCGHLLVTLFSPFRILIVYRSSQPRWKPAYCR